MKRTTILTLAVAAVSLALYGGHVAQAGCSAIAGNQATPFQAGVPNPNNGFAEFVTDSNGLALELCLDPANCFFDPVIAGNLFSEQIGFGAEAFWWLADASITTTNAAGNPLLAVTVVMGAEAAFLPGVADGNQFPFTRLRIRMDVPQPGVYTLTHPYGTQEFTVNAVGAGLEVSTTTDIQFTPGVFDAATGAPTTTQNQGCVGPWLQWDAGAPAGFIGDGGAVPHTVTGSPTNKNFIEVSAVDLQGSPIALDGTGSSTVSTNLFNVTGKLYDAVLATPMVSDRTSYERDATASTGHVDVFATAAQTATVTFTGSGNLPSGDIPLAGDPGDQRVAGKFFASTPLTPDASVVPPVVALNATAATTDGTRLLRLVTDLVTVTKAQYNLDDQTLTVDAVSTDMNLTPELRVAEYDLPLPAQIVTDAPPATVNVTSAVGGTHERQVEVIDNRAPVAADDIFTVGEDSVANSLAVLADNGNGADSDADGINAASVHITGGPANGTAQNIGDGTIRYTPDANFNGADSLTYTVKDNTGILSNEATVFITVTAVNDNPVAVDDEASTDNATPVTIDVLGNDSDVDIATNGDVLVVNAIDTTSTSGNVINNGANVTYTPSAGFTGDDTFGYTVGDGNGGSASATVTVHVSAVNFPPIAQDDTFTVAEDSGTTGLDVIKAGSPAGTSGKDTDPEGDTLTITAVTQPAAGAGSVASNGASVSYSTAPNFNGTASFSYTIDDGNGNTASASVTVNVTAVNDNPVAVGDSASTTSGTPVTINVLGNDVDVDGDTLTVTAVVSPTANGGTVVRNADNTVTYTSAASFSGTDSFGYTIGDGNGGSATATVAVEVSGVAGLVNLNISSLRATGRVNAGGTVTLSLAVRNGGSVDDQRPATIVGVSPAGVIYRQTVLVNDPLTRGSTTFSFPSYTTKTTDRGTITWTATLVDDNPDVDQATTTTRVR